MIENYFERIRKILTNSIIIQAFELDTEKRSESLGFIRGNVTFIDGARLYIREFVEVELNIDLTFPAIFLFEQSPKFLLSQRLILSSAIVIKDSLLKTAKSLKPLFGRHFQT